MEAIHLEGRVVAELLVRSCKILHKFPEGGGFDIYLKTSRNMPKGISGCLPVNTEIEIELRVSEELTYLVASEYTRLNLLRTKPLEFLTQEGESRTISV
jgi:hypothetical protein